MHCHNLSRVTAAGLLFAATAAFAQSSSPVVLTFSTVGDSRQDPITYDQASVGTPLTGQDAMWLQNTKAFGRILRTIQTQKPQMLFFNGDMIHGYGWAEFGYTTNADQTKINGSTKSADPVADASWTTRAQVLNSDLLAFYKQYAYWRGLVAPVLETGTYVLPVAGNHETQCKACKPGKVAKQANEEAWAANMGDLIVDATRFAAVTGTTPGNIAYGPAAGSSPDGLTTDQRKLSYSFDAKGFHFVVINTDAVGADSTAPTVWLSADLAAAKARGVKKSFVFGHKPAYTYAYDVAPTVTAAGGLDAADTAKRNAFWDAIEAAGAIYFCGHEHVYNISQPRNGAYQVIVGAGGSPFDVKSGVPTKHPATDRSYSWATVRLHADGSVDLLGYGFDEHFGPTALIDQIYIP
ncbi:MAG: metallophosphoesterase [Burkholderiales bacterium]|nr:metallophosphoesterase [Burkholderiales bacterium]